MRELVKVSVSICVGVIDAAVQGGVKKYREAFFESDYLSSYPEDKIFVDPFHEAMQQQIQVLTKGLDLFDSHCTEQLRPLYLHQREMFEKMQRESKAT